MLTRRNGELEANFAGKDEMEQISVEDITTFLEKEPIPKWMTTLCCLVVQFPESKDDTKGDTLTNHASGLFCKSQQTYVGKY